MNEVLISQGWTMYHQCSGCSGGRRQFYSNAAYPNHEVKVNISRSAFSILMNNHLIAGPCWLYQLKEKMTENDIWKN